MLGFIDEISEAVQQDPIEWLEDPAVLVLIAQLDEPALQREEGVVRVRQGLRHGVIRHERGAEGQARGREGMITAHLRRSAPAADLDVLHRLVPEMCLDPRQDGAANLNVRERRQEIARDEMTLEV